VRRDVFQAIADPTRRAILALLAVGALTPTAIADHFGSTRQTVSQHLQLLTECDVLRPQKSGREIYYHVNLAKLQEVDTWLHGFRQLWQDRFDQLDTLLTTL